MSGASQARFGFWLALLLCIVSIGFFDGYPRYLPIGPEMLRDPKPASLAEWGREKPQAQVDDGGVLLFSADGQRSVSIAQTLAGPFPSSLLLLRCSMKTEEVVKGEKDWDSARVILLSKNAAGKPLYDRPHQLRTLDGSHGWRHYQKAFSLDADVAAIEVAAQLNRSSGKFWVRDFSLRPVTIKDRFFEIRDVLLISWIIFLGWMGLPMLRASLRSPDHAWLLLTILAILAGVALPRDLAKVTESLLFPDYALAHADQIDRVAADGQFFDFTARLPPLEGLKIGHFVLFAVLATILTRGKPYRMSLSVMLAYLTLLALTSEVLQLLIPGRSSQLGDIGIDMLGAVCGIALATSLKLFRRST